MALLHKLLPFGALFEGQKSLDNDSVGLPTFYRIPSFSLSSFSLPDARP